MANRTFALLIVGVCLGAILSSVVSNLHTPASAEESKVKALDTLGLTTELEAAKSKLPDQAHAMQDVGYHFTNLWFAGKQENWELANFYLSESRSHLRWAVRIIPKRKDTAGREIDLAAILESLENGSLKQVETAIKSKSKADFEKTYRLTLEGCYACHKASEKAFIRPQVPTEPEVHIVNFDPQADWPK